MHEGTVRTRTNTETPGRGASNEVTYASVCALLVSFCFLRSIETRGSEASRARESNWLGRSRMTFELFEARWGGSSARTRSELCTAAALAYTGWLWTSKQVQAAPAGPHHVPQRPQHHASQSITYSRPEVGWVARISGTRRVFSSPTRALLPCKSALQPDTRTKQLEAG